MNADIGQADTETVRLDWQGPITAEELGADRASADIHGVYLLIQETRDGKTCLYVGSSNSVRKRFKSHIQATFGLAYYLNDEDGQWYPESDAEGWFWRSLADPMPEVERAVKQIQRTLFAWAETPAARHVSVERTIYRQMSDMAGRDLVIIHNGAAIGRRAGQPNFVNVVHGGSDRIRKIFELGADPTAPS